jgi:hypothetical protein
VTLLIEDTPRNNLAVWTSEAAQAGSVGGAVLSPFASSATDSTYKPSGYRIADQIRAGGGQVWFDASTYALGVPGVGDFRHYETWDLWDGNYGILDSAVRIEGHVTKVLAIQRALGVPSLAPSVLLSGPSTADVGIAIALAIESLSADPLSYLTIAGTPDFWRGGAELDTLVGTIAQLGATGFFLVVGRPVADLPPAASADEIAGLCRTARSLSAFGHVHVSYGDFAGLPVVAAGAGSIGTGWDSRQRVCSYTSYATREPTAGGGGWLKRPTFRGLLASIPRNDAERLFSQNPALASNLYVGSLDPDAPKEAFLHHVRCLNFLVESVGATADYEERFKVLCSIYEDATTAWPLAIAAASTVGLATVCIGPLYEGLRSYGREEGWVK